MSFLGRKIIFYIGFLFALFVALLFLPFPYVHAQSDFWFDGFEEYDTGSIGNEWPYYDFGGGGAPSIVVVDDPVFEGSRSLHLEEPSSPGSTRAGRTVWEDNSAVPSTLPDEYWYVEFYWRPDTPSTSPGNVPAGFYFDLEGDPESSGSLSNPNFPALFLRQAESSDVSVLDHDGHTWEVEDNEWHKIEFRYNFEQDTDTIAMRGQYRVNDSEWSPLQLGSSVSRSGDEIVLVFRAGPHLGQSWVDNISVQSLGGDDDESASSFEPITRSSAYDTRFIDYSFVGSDLEIDYDLVEDEVESGNWRRNPTHFRVQTAEDTATSTYSSRFFDLPDQYGEHTYTFPNLTTQLSDGLYTFSVSFYSYPNGVAFDQTNIYFDVEVENGEFATVQRDSVADARERPPSGAIATQECGLTSIGGCIINAASFLFMPSDYGFSRFEESYRAFEETPPFSYTFQLRDIIVEVPTNPEQFEGELDVSVPVSIGDTSTSTFTLFNTQQHIIENPFLPDGFVDWARAFFAMALWLTFVFYLFNTVMALSRRMST